MDQTEKYVFDQTFNENHVKQNGGLKPILCNVANRVNNRYYMEFIARSVLFFRHKFISII